MLQPVAQFSGHHKYGYIDLHTSSLRHGQHLGVKGHVSRSSAVVFARLTFLNGGTGEADGQVLHQLPASNGSQRLSGRLHGVPRWFCRIRLTHVCFHESGHTCTREPADSGL